MTKEQLAAIDRLREFIAETASAAEHDDDDYTSSCNWYDVGAALDALLAELRQLSPCVCTIVEPCHESCTCVVAVSSRGCRRCAKYGSEEQRLAKATWLASVIDAARVKRAAELAGEESKPCG